MISNTQYMLQRNIKGFDTWLDSFRLDIDYMEREQIEELIIECSNYNKSNCSWIEYDATMYILEYAKDKLGEMYV